MVLFFLLKPPQSTAFHPFRLDGYPARFFHPEHYVAKGLGVVRLNVGGFEVAIAVVHLRAMHSAEPPDIYRPIRITQAIQMANVLQPMCW